MTAETMASESTLDRRIAWRAFLIALAFFPAAGIINALSILTDAERMGQAFDPREAFILELTSIAGILIAFPLIVVIERKMPLTAEGWKLALAAYALGSIAFSALHVAIMVALREATFPILLSRDYSFFGEFVRDGIYEYRKDIVPYAAMIAVLSLLRQIEQGRMEAAAARAEARDTGRITLKSGGRTIFLDARSLDWAEAAGNYVEVHAAGRSHLARISLSALAGQLGDAGVDVARIHRSRIVNRANVAEIVPSGDGDFRVRLRNGSELRGSRRYRLE